MQDVYIKIIELPLKVKGVTIPNSDGYFCVFINSKLSKEEQQLAINHESMHIKLNHFYNNKPIFVNEQEADNSNKISIQVYHDNNLLMVK